VFVALFVLVGEKMNFLHHGYKDLLQNKEEFICFWSLKSTMHSSNLPMIGYFPTILVGRLPISI
jgi:hypothetical protein